MDIFLYSYQPHPYTTSYFIILQCIVEMNQDPGLLLLYLYMYKCCDHIHCHMQLVGIHCEKAGSLELTNSLTLRSVRVKVADDFVDMLYAAG
jgi:hypothetical protein